MQITPVVVRVPIYYSLSIIFRAENNLFNSNFCRAKVRDNLYMLNNRDRGAVFYWCGLIEHRRCEISRGETFEIKSPEMPGNTSNFNNHHKVAYSFCLDSYIFNANICIEQKLLVGF